MQNHPWNGRKKRRMRYDRPRWGRIALLIISAALLVFGLVKLIGYGMDLLSSRRTSAELQSVYHAAPTEAPATVTPTAQNTFTPIPETPVPSPSPTGLPSPTPVARLQQVAYPGNADLQVSSRFKSLQKKSKYIVGWLTVDRMLDEAVVQRDNVYYLDHDALGKENVNGALFLDSAVSLKTRPYTLMVYGHNMRSGAMFGNLRNFENISFYHNSPFITFDTQYEPGRYVIFAVSTVNTEEAAPNYLDFYSAFSLDAAERQQVLDTLIANSAHTCTVDVAADDQLLLLVTCVEKDEERRVVAARRVREDESESDLKRAVERSRKII